MTQTEYFPTHKPHTFAIATANTQAKIAKEYVFPTLKIGWENKNEMTTMYINHWAISDYIKVSAFK